jgi:hypothetical protein
MSHGIFTIPVDSTVVDALGALRICKYPVNEFVNFMTMEKSPANARSTKSANSIRSLHAGLAMVSVLPSEEYVHAPDSPRVLYVFASFTQRASSGAALTLTGVGARIKEPWVPLEGEVTRAYM